MTVLAQELITCHQRNECTGTIFENVTIQDCCDNVNGGRMDGIGLGASFELDGCIPCPVG